MSLWCLMASPLFYSGDMNRLDPFTLNVLCNSEVIEVDQDPLGQCAEVVPLAGKTFLMVKSLDDGSTAVGLGNGGESPATVTATWAALKLTGKHVVRDLWPQKDLGTFDGQWSTTVARHGVALVRIRPAGS
jgi:alpha-galactosidase